MARPRLFTEAKVAQIKARYAKGDITIAELAEKYRCAITTMWTYLNPNARAAKSAANARYHRKQRRGR